MPNSRIILLGKSEVKEPIRRLRSRWKDNGCESGSEPFSSIKSGKSPPPQKQLAFQEALSSM
jgi:hypothetical protein